MYGKNYQIRQDDRMNIDTVCEYIETHYSEPLSIPQLAKVVHISPTKLKCCFLLICGDTIHSYLTRVRVENAKRLIREGNFQLSEIASMVGFVKTGSFSAVFRKRTGMLPRDYRKIYREEKSCG